MAWEDAGEGYMKNPKKDPEIKYNNEFLKIVNSPWGRAFGWNSDACLLGKDSKAHNTDVR